MAQLARGLARDGKLKVSYLSGFGSPSPKYPWCVWILYHHTTIISWLPPFSHKKTRDAEECLSYHSSKWSRSWSALRLFYQLVPCASKEAWKLRRPHYFTVLQGKTIPWIFTIQGPFQTSIQSLNIKWKSDWLTNYYHQWKAEDVCTALYPVDIGIGKKQNTLSHQSL